MDQTYDLLAALFDPRQIGATNPMWDYALSLYVAAGTDATHTTAEIASSPARARREIAVSGWEDHAAE